MTTHKVGARSLALLGLVCAGDLVAQSPAWLRARSIESGTYAMAYDLARQRAVMCVGRPDYLGLPCDTWEWDGVRWSQRIPAGPSPRGMSHAVAYDIARQRTLLFGGSTNGTSLDDTWEWDGATWSLAQPATRPPARSDPAMAYDFGRRRVVMFGGTGSTGSSLGDTWEWDGNTWIQRHSTPSPVTRSSSAMAYDVVRQRVVLFGGFWAFGYALDTWEWDGNTWTSRQPTNVPPARAGHTMVYDATRRRVVMFAGGSPNGALADVWEWDGSDWNRRAASPGPSAGAWRAAYDVHRQRMVVFGGDTWEWDGIAWALRQPSGTMLPRRASAIAEDTGRGRLVLFGGYRGFFSSPRDDTWEWDGTTWLERRSSTTPPALAEHAMAYDQARRRTVLFGGSACGFSKIRCPVAEMWEWDGTTWRPLQPTTRPPARFGHALTYDAGRSRVVLFGGANSTFLGDTWEWDGVNWIQRQPATSPPARSHHAMAYDAARQRVVLHGGGFFGSFGDTWEWDGVTWTQRQSSVTPGGRRSHVMAYDATRRRVVLFGGESNSPLGDTWEWDGNVWTFVPLQPGPLPSHEGVLAYHAARQELVLVTGSGRGSVGNPVLIGDTWRYGALIRSSGQLLGRGCGGADGPPVLTSNEPYLGNARFTLEVLSARASAPCVLAMSGSTQNLAIGACTLYLRDPMISWPTPTSVSGTAASTLGIPRVANLRGVSLYAQAFVLDPRGGALGLAFTAGRTLRIGD